MCFITEVTDSKVHHPKHETNQSFKSRRLSVFDCQKTMFGKASETGFESPFET